MYYGVYAFGREQTQDSNIINSKKLANIEENTTINEIKNEAISVSSKQVITSPNCTIVEKQYFKGCDHLIKNIKELPTNWINFTEEQIQEQYPEWTVESFTNNQIIMYKEEEGFCDEHYVIREHNGLLGIYTLDEEGNETFKEDTDIWTNYLPDEDLEKVKKGIEAIGNDGLHKVLEDFE